MTHSKPMAALAIVALVAASAVANAQDLAKERLALCEGLVPQLEELAEWCGKNGLAAQRHVAYENLLRFAPDHKKARRVLKYRKRDGEWQQSKSYRQPRNSRKKNVPEGDSRRAAIVGPFVEKAIGLLEKHGDGASPAARNQVLDDLLALDPKNEKVRGLLGQVREGGMWFLKSTIDSEKRRDHLKTFARAKVEKLPEPKPSGPTGAETKLELNWTKGYEVEHGVRVIGTTDEDEIMRVARCAQAAVPVFREALQTRTTPFRDTIVYLLDPASGESFFERLHKLTPQQKEFAKKLHHWVIPSTAHAVAWAEESPGRIDAGIRQFVHLLLWREFKITLDHGWVAEGVGLYISHLVTGTRLNWFVKPSEYARSPDEDAFKNRLMKDQSDWIAEGGALLESRKPNLMTIMSRNVNEMSVEELLIAYLFAEYLIEARPKDVARVLKRVGAGDPPTRIIQNVLKMDPPDLDKKFARWIEETLERR